MDLLVSFRGCWGGLEVLEGGAVVQIGAIDDEGELGLEGIDGLGGAEDDAGVETLAGLEDPGALDGVGAADGLLPSQVVVKACRPLCPVEGVGVRAIAHVAHGDLGVPLVVLTGAVGGFDRVDPELHGAGVEDLLVLRQYGVSEGQEGGGGRRAVFEEALLRGVFGHGGKGL